MGKVTYTVKIPELLKRLELKPFSLVRLCGLAVDTAYRAANPKEADELSLSTAWKVYKGLVEKGYDISWNDVVEFKEQ